MHCVRKVTEDLYWVGANDRRTALFENIHPIPRGVSYNSYLLLDEQTVLFDSVDWSAAPQLLENVEYVLAGRELDCIVLHHLEPDHGAGLQLLLRRWPNVKIIAGVTAFTFLDQFGFSAKEETRLAVKDGAQVSFGKHTLTFYSAPMVHWPDVLVSFEETEGLLFTADAFGAFGALNGKIFNDELNIDRDWLDEYRRYYTNIVGKFGPSTQALLKKVAGIQDKVKFICPLHGPVWRSDFGYLIEKYDKWSRYEPEEKGVLVVYGSMYGNTEQAAEALATALTERGVKVEMYDVSRTNVSYLIGETFKYSHVALACVTYNMGVYPPMHAYLSDMRALAVQNRTFAIVENGTWVAQSGAKMTKFVTEKMKNCSVLEAKLSLRSSLPGSRAEEVAALADAIAASVNG